MAQPARSLTDMNTTKATASSVASRPPHASMAETLAGLMPRESVPMVLLATYDHLVTVLTAIEGAEGMASDSALLDLCIVFQAIPVRPKGDVVLVSTVEEALDVSDQHLAAIAQLLTFREVAKERELSAEDQLVVNAAENELARVARELVEAEEKIRRMDTVLRDEKIDHGNDKRKIASQRDELARLNAHQQVVERELTQLNEQLRSAQRPSTREEDLQRKLRDAEARAFNQSEQVRLLNLQTKNASAQIDETVRLSAQLLAAQQNNSRLAEALRDRNALKEAAENALAKANLEINRLAQLVVEKKSAPLELSILKARVANEERIRREMVASRDARIEELKEELDRSRSAMADRNAELAAQLEPALRTITQVLFGSTLSLRAVGAGPALAADPAQVETEMRRLNDELDTLETEQSQFVEDEGAEVLAPGYLKVHPDIRARMQRIEELRALTSKYDAWLRASKAVLKNPLT